MSRTSSAVKAVAAAETTPLLQDAAGQGDGNGLVGGNIDAGVATAAMIVPASADEDRPMATTQVALLCFARLLEPIAFFSVFPYINQMVQDNGGVASSDVGFYSGLIESLFSLTQALVMMGWGRAADRVGRKPVLVLSLVGMASATALFGTARTLVQMVAFRCLAGVFAGTIVTIRTMLAELSTPKTQARVFSWFAFSGNLGLFVGPLMGGALATPLGRPNPDDPTDNVPFLVAYPYALPGFVVAGLGYLAALLCALFVEETLVVKKKKTSSTPTTTTTTTTTVTASIANDDEPAAPPPSIGDLFRAPGVKMVLLIYAQLMLLAFSYTALVPVFWFTPVDLGGFGFTPVQISAMMGLVGASQSLWLLAFPPLHRRIGTNAVIRACAIAYPCFMSGVPFMSLILRVWNARTLFWIVVPPTLAIGSGVSLSFTAIQLAVNDTAPSPQLLGTLNALALTGVSMIRAFTPALFTALYAISVRNQLLWGYGIWVLMVLISLGFTLSAQYLPDYDELKKARTEAEAEPNEARE
ncbi:uncharacterized protein SPSK_05209 [Sporothrix schenckii 1099-18]|uniref:Major facilitator superfamily (MFS) profile domain-containing protein n=1 Tax=Sporothrix schenckii 1099-18 TaxID=1397361 RepID=A0A0F2LVV8_SPOSC|nr:uncharacterized protein SPSK_05209 [Sporothrix schenckii 1099-18]KJR80635.1 hypothetical protein SPSK_05209 [Sporothrix schenckii 1099-18]